MYDALQKKEGKIPLNLCTISDGSPQWKNPHILPIAASQLVDAPTLQGHQRSMWWKPIHWLLDQQGIGVAGNFKMWKQKQKNTYGWRVLDISVYCEMFLGGFSTF